MKRISIFGLGYVGSVSAACLADKGYWVIGVDANPHKVDLIQAGSPTIVEPSLAALTKRAVDSKKLRATMDVADAIFNSEISYVCVGTPSKPDNSLDLQYVKRVCEQIGDALREKSSYHIVVIRSTLFPGSMQQVVIPIIESHSGKTALRDFSICINPEFMKEGSAVHDFYHPPKNVLGTADPIAIETLSDINLHCTGMKTIVIDMAAAELVKYCDNVFHALKVGFANEIGNVCKALGIDSHTVMDVFCQDTKLNLSSYYLKPGFAFGGSCLPKDLRAFLHQCQALNVTLPIISAVLPSNQLQIERGLQMVMRLGKKRIGILGFSFKANTDDLRESPMVELIERLIGKGYSLALFDKNVNVAKCFGANRDYLLNHIPHISMLMVNDIQEILDWAEVIVIGNGASEFADIMSRVSADQTVIDLVRVSKEKPKHAQYAGICW